MKRQSKWRQVFRALLFVVGGILLYVEYVSYYLQAWGWKQLACPSGSTCTRLLLVADPQIIGERDELLWITRWDSDRYLSSTYRLAYQHASPDAVVFLGDLMDEGSRANDWEFKRYAERFFSIFPSDPKVKALYVPGDNDIGGENGEPILPDVVWRFRRTFNRSAEIIVGPTRIIKVNPVVETMPLVDASLVATDRLIRVAVSHFPLIGLSSPFSDKMVQQLQPHVVFSAHTHTSRLRRGTMASKTPLVSLLPISIRRGDPSRPGGDDGWTNAEDVLEIVVPTCSYRMGVPLMGYGFAVIDSTRRELWYVVLWLPSRFHQLFLYVLLIALVSFVGTINSCSEKCKRTHNSYTQLCLKSHA